MNEREPRETGSEAGRASRDERLRSLLQAAYPAAEPDEALQQGVAAMVERHAARAAQRRERWRLLCRWEPALGAVAAAALLAALGLMLARQGHPHSTGNPAPSIASIAHPPRRAPGPQPRPLMPRNDRGSRMAAQPPAQPAGGLPIDRPFALPPAGTPTWRAPGSYSAPSPQVQRGHRQITAHSVDDMAYVNSDPEKAMRPWAAVPGDEWARVEARVRRHIPVKDDFVTIPFPRLASVSPRQIAGAVASYQHEAGIVDPRLIREVTLACKGMALSDLCDRLRDDTGIELSAGPSVADEKVTVFCDKTRLRDVMRQLSRAFGYTWLRSGRQGAYKYELEQDLRSQLLEEELRNRDRDAALLALDARMQQFRPFLGMSFEELKKRWDAIPEQKKRQPWKRLDDGSGIGQMWELVAGDWGAVQLYHRLTPRDRDALMAGEELVFRPDAPNPERRLPSGWDHQLLLSMPVTTNVNGRPVPIAAAPDIQFDELRLGAHRTELGEVTLKAGLSATPDNRQQDGGPRWGVIQQVATAHSPSAVNPDNAVANRALRNHPPFEQVVSLHPTPSCPVVKEEPGDKYLLSADEVTIDFDPSQPHATSADVWGAVHQATGLPIVADYYTHLYPLSQVTVDHEPLFAALCKVGDALDVRWRKEGDFLVGRSARFFWDRLEEVPNRYLQRWAQDRDTRGGLPLADFLEMASLSDPQLDAGAVAQGIERGWGLREWAWARSPTGRQHARCLALLTPEQLRRAQEPAGLPFNELSPAQQQAAARVEYEAEAAIPGTEAPPPAMRSPEELARAAITACYVPAGWYVAQVPLGSGDKPSWTGPWHYAGGRTEAEAIAAARQRYPGSAPLKVSRARDGFFTAGM